MKFFFAYILCRVGFTRKKKELTIWFRPAGSAGFADSFSLHKAAKFLLRGFTLWRFANFACFSNFFANFVANDFTRLLSISVVGFVVA